MSITGPVSRPDETCVPTYREPCPSPRPSSAPMREEPANRMQNEHPVGCPLQTYLQGLSVQLDLHAADDRLYRALQRDARRTISRSRVVAPVGSPVTCS